MNKNPPIPKKGDILLFSPPETKAQRTVQKKVECPLFSIDPNRIEVIDDAQAEILKRKTPTERIAMVMDCHRTMRLLIAGGLRTRHPDWDQEKINAAVAERILHGAS